MVYLADHSSLLIAIINSASIIVVAIINKRKTRVIEKDLDGIGLAVGTVRAKARSQNQESPKERPQAD